MKTERQTRRQRAHWLPVRTFLTYIPSMTTSNRSPQGEAARSKEAYNDELENGRVCPSHKHKHEASGKLHLNSSLTTKLQAGREKATFPFSLKRHAYLPKAPVERRAHCDNYRHAEGAMK